MNGRLYGRVGRGGRRVKPVAKELGITPAVARASYVDPQVTELYGQGQTVTLPDTAPADGQAAGAGGPAAAERLTASPLL